MLQARSANAQRLRWRRAQIASRVTTCSHPHGNRIEWRAIEFPVFAVGNSNGATSRTEIRTHDRKLACQAIGLVERDICVFQDHAALIFELLAYDEIKIKVGHTNRLQFYCVHKSTT